jgi:hypothetical protein
VPAARAVFAERLSLLFACADEPSSLQVATLATAVQSKLYPGMPAVADQRISDWRNAKCAPQHFEPFEPVARVLITKAVKRKTPPAIPGLYDLEQWRKWWHEARTATTNAAGQPPQTTSPACPYQGLAAFETTDQDRFFGRTRATGKLVALIRKVRAADPGIVLLTGPSGAGKSSLLSAGLSPAMSAGALGSDQGWVPARMTPGDNPMAGLARCLEQPDVKERAEGIGLLLIVDQAEQLFMPKVSAESGFRGIAGGVR